MTWGAVAVAGASVVGGVMASNASGKAADSQAASAAQADATQRYQYDTTRADNAPFRDTGVAANNRLSVLLGLGGTSSGPSGSALTSNDMIDTSGGAWQPNATLYGTDPTYKNAWDQFSQYHMSRHGRLPSGEGLRGEGNQHLRELGFDLNKYNETVKNANQTSAENDPAYGSLMRNFSAADLNADPVYQSGLQFGLDEGTKGINRIAAASGSMLSGATLKALTKYGNDYGSTKANEAFNRFNTNQDRTYNKLAGVSGAGQQATNQVSAAGQNMANNISASQIGVGNARAASSIGGTNALVGAMNQGVSAWSGYNQNQAMLNAPGAAFQPTSGWINNNGGGF